MLTLSPKRGVRNMDRKILSISSKRQITIPQKFYQSLGFGDEAECIMRGNELILRPVNNISDNEFAEQILTELIADGLSGEALLSTFKEKQSQVKLAINSMLTEARNVAENKSAYITYDDVFKTED